jgi:hypothetical protein
LAPVAEELGADSTLEGLDEVLANELVAIGVRLDGAAN